MLLSTRQRMFAVLLALAVFAAAQEPVKPKLTPRIITATKQVTMFTGIETQMLRAVEKKDKAALEAMLAEDCIIEMPDADPLPADEWLDSVLSKDFTLKSFAIRQMSVSLLNDSAAVKYDRVQESTYQGKPDGGEFFVIDLWKKSGDSWKLANRYVAKVSSTPYMPKGPVKPTGKQ